MKITTDPRPDLKRVGIVGSGVIGRSWANLFLREGCQVRIYDRDPEQLEKALAWLQEDWEKDVAEGLIDDSEQQSRLDRHSTHVDLADALQGVDYVQESGPERLPQKQALFKDLDRLAPGKAILASSTSTFDMTDIAQDLPGAARCVVAHPLNPPHMIPAVEVIPGKSTHPETVERCCAFLSEVGQFPVQANFYAFGFIANRLQAALVQEALHIVSTGIADVEAVDAVICEGLGLRWALLGPFGVGNLNADHGIREYYGRFQQAYIDLMKHLGEAPSFDESLIEKVGAGTDRMMGSADLSDVRRWRDQMIQRLRQLKSENPRPE